MGPKYKSLVRFLQKCEVRDLYGRKNGWICIVERQLRSGSAGRSYHEARCWTEEKPGSLAGYGLPSYGLLSLKRKLSRDVVVGFA